MPRKKSLLIGINYIGTQNQLAGCIADIENVGHFIAQRGYPSDPQSQVVLRDDRQGLAYPSGENMIQAMSWLVSEPNTTCFMHYSGHGGQVRDDTGDRASGFDDTLVPVDFEQRGQISSDTLHKVLVSRLPPSSTLFVVLDCCHSGSALELPFVFRSDASGNVSMMDNLKQGGQLLSQAAMLIQGGRFDPQGAMSLFNSASSFIKSYQNQHAQGGGGGGGQGGGDGLAQEHFAEDWTKEKKHATMFSGCRDEQTSADAHIGGAATGAMSWAFLKAVRSDATPTYSEVLRATRQLLGQSNFQQVPQLSMGIQMDLDAPLML